MIRQIENLGSLEESLARVQILSSQLLEAIGAVRRALPENLMQSRALRMAELAGPMIESSGFSLEDLRSHRRDSFICDVRFGVMRGLSAAGFADSEIDAFLRRSRGAMRNLRKKERA